MEHFDRLRQELPPVLTRKTAAAAIGAYSPGTLANLDSRGLGPKRSVIGGKTVYLRDDFIEWLAARAQRPRSGGLNSEVQAE